MSSFIISDLHFGHENLCRNLRGMSAEENDALLIQRWNNIINKHDKVWILGDITLDKPELIKNIIPQLRGFKEVILGNHDTPRCVKALIECGCKISAYEKVHNLLLTHIPIHPSQLINIDGNVHGHIHLGEYFNAIDDKRYYNVNCELHNYTPIPFEIIDKYYQDLKLNENE